MAEPKKRDEVLAEFPGVRRYKVRLLATGMGPMLDIREHIKTDSFQGFTRRGVRLAHPADVIELVRSLTEVLTPAEPEHSSPPL